MVKFSPFRRMPLTKSQKKMRRSTCNTGLGQFKDDIVILSSAISYLESFRKKDEYENEVNVAG